MSRLRVCSIDEEGRFGGPESRITQIAKALKEYDVETHVVYPLRDSQRFSEELFKAGVVHSAFNITRLSKEKKILGWYIIGFFAEVIHLCLFFRRESFDLVQVNGSQQFKGALAARMAGIPVVWVLEDALMARSIRAICRFLVRYTTAGVIVVGQRVYDYYLKGTLLESKPCCEIHPPVDTAIFSPKASKTLKSSSKKIVTVSGINPTKGLEFFIEMASILIERKHDAVFLIAAAKLNSQKKYYQHLKDLIHSYKLNSDQVRFVGMVDDIPAFLQEADVFVCTSVSESGPMAVWEAMSMGKPVVSTDVGSVSKYVENDTSGFVVPTENAQALADKVGLLMIDENLSERVGAKAYKIARRELDVSIAAKKYYDFYRDILSQSMIVRDKEELAPLQ